MKARVTKYKAIFLDKVSGRIVELEGGYTGKQLKMDLSKYAKGNDLKLIGVAGRSTVMAEIEAPLFIEITDADEGEEVHSND